MDCPLAPDGERKAWACALTCGKSAARCMVACACACITRATATARSRLSACDFSMRSDNSGLSNVRHQPDCGQTCSGPMIRPENDLGTICGVNTCGTSVAQPQSRNNSIIM